MKIAKKQPKRHVTKKTPKEKILIIEDDASLRMALSEKLARAKFEVLTAGNGKVGLKSALINKPDLIILDILMPVMDGMTMLKKLRKDLWGATVYVIMLTNKEPDMSLLDEAKKIPYLSSYIMKDGFDIADIVKIVKSKIKYSFNIQKTITL
jgi:CheY-like chemotaxis protein